MADIRVRVGQQNSVKILSSASGGEALTAITAQNVVGGIASVSSLDVNTGISTFGADVHFKGVAGIVTASWDASDNSFLYNSGSKLKFGTASTQLEIYNDGSNSYLSELGAGSLRIGYGGTAELYNGSTKVFETISTGATVTGDLYVSGDLFLSDDIVLDNISAQSLNITGISTLSVLTATRVPFVGTGSTLRDSAGFTFDGLTDSLSIGGNLSVGGTVTYEDVTNVDSVGLVTAGKGFRATTGGLIVTAGIATFGAIATFTQDAYVDGTLTAGLIDGGSY
tara:strand:- start:582 stop:1424 length:843 start_codon:yes stop_codon:yes gene_type:complete